MLPRRLSLQGCVPCGIRPVADGHMCPSQPGAGPGAAGNAAGLPGLTLARLGLAMRSGSW